METVQSIKLQIHLPASSGKCRCKDERPVCWSWFQFSHKLLAEINLKQVKFNSFPCLLYVAQTHLSSEHCEESTVPGDLPPLAGGELQLQPLHGGRLQPLLGVKDVLVTVQAEQVVRSYCNQADVTGLALQHLLRVSELLQLKHMPLRHKICLQTL